MVADVEVEGAPQKPMSRIKQCRRALLSVLIALVAVECFLRCVDLPLVAPRDFVAGKDANRSFEFDFQTMWRFPHDPVEKWGPSARDEFGNRFGCRGYEPAAKKSNADLRIICVGASGVSGFAMPFGWSFGILLERRLQSQFPGARVETVLAGVAGFSSEQQRALLEEKMDDFQPDLVIFLAETHNDIEEAGSRSDQENLDRLRPGFSRTWDLLRFKYKFMNDFSNIGSHQNSGSDTSTASFRVPLPRFVENFSSMLTWVKDKGGTPIVVLSPVAKEGSPEAIYRAEVEMIVGQLEVASLDLSVVAPNPSDWLDSVHLSMAGHENLASALQGIVYQKNLLPNSSMLLGRAAPDFALLDVVPKQITIGQEETLRIQLSGLKQEDLCRVWCGGLLTRFSWREDGILELTLPRLLPARLVSIELVTTQGSRMMHDAVRVHPPKLHIDVGSAGSLVFRVDLPEEVEVAFVATLQPRKEPFPTEIGPIIRAQGQSWPPPVNQNSAFYRDHVLAHGASTMKGPWTLTWKTALQLPPGTPIAIQGLLGIPSPGDFVPIAVTTAEFLIVPK